MSIFVLHMQGQAPKLPKKPVDDVEDDDVIELGDDDDDFEFEDDDNDF